MKSMSVFLASFTLSLVCFFSDNITCTEVSQALIMVDNMPCNSVRTILQMKKPKNVDRLLYKGCSIKDLDQTCRNFLIDYAALSAEESVDNDVFLGRIGYLLGWDLKELCENEKFRDIISNNSLARKLMVRSEFTGCGGQDLWKEMQSNRRILENIVAEVEKECGINKLSDIS